MSIGDRSDFLTRIKSLLPNGWFGDSTPVLDTVLTGISDALSRVYSLIAYARLQVRIATATDIFLDLISFDYLGTTLPRRAGESDTAFRTRIRAELLLEKATRKGMIATLVELTGREPIIFEPARPADTGGYNTGALAYGMAGGYGSLALPYQAFITAYRPAGQGVPLVAGYGSPQGAYSTPSRLEYVGADMIAGAVTDADIYAAIDSTKVAGTIIWVRISSAPPAAVMTGGGEFLTEGGDTIDTEAGDPITYE